MTSCSLLAKEGTDLKCGAAGAGASRSSAPGCGAGSLSLWQPRKCTWSWQGPCHSAPPTHLLQGWAVVCMCECAGGCVEIESILSHGSGGQSQKPRGRQGWFILEAVRESPAWPLSRCCGLLWVHGSNPCFHLHTASFDVCVPFCPL